MTTILRNRDDGGIDELLKYLKTYPLARRLTYADMPEEKMFINHNHIGTGASFLTDKGICYPVSETQLYTGLTVFSGNFFNWSWTFQVATDDGELIETLITAIRENMVRADYLAQDKPTMKMGKHYLLCADGTELWFKNGEYAPIK